MRTTTGALVATALVLSAAAAEAADELTLQLKWVTQAQFAGYYVALEKGYYEDADLDVTILPGGPDIAPPQVIAGGGADVIIEWMPAALASRERGVELVNIAQIFDRSGMMLTCRKDSGHPEARGLPGSYAGRLVLRQRIPVPVLDEPPRHPDRRQSGRGHGAEAGLQRRSACCRSRPTASRP